MLMLDPDKHPCEEARIVHSSVTKALGVCSLSSLPAAGSARIRQLLRWQGTLCTKLTFLHSNVELWLNVSARLFRH